MARQNSDTLSGFLDPGCTVRGELEFSSTFRVDGRLEGTVSSKAELIVGEQGHVEGTISVARCLVGGTVKGAITASERVVLHAGAKVWADLAAPTIVMEDGAFFEGKITMSGKTPAAASPHVSSARKREEKS
jgi:cytoskeletal protein CcmA (bactofilin family)